MSVRMASLWRDPKTGKWCSRKVIPKPLWPVFGKREDKPRWPASLSQAEAKEAFSVWLGDIEARIEAAKSGVTVLTDDHIKALSVRWYQQTLAMWEQRGEPLQSLATHLEWLMTSRDSPALQTFYAAETEKLLQRESIAARQSDKERLAKELQRLDIELHRTAINRLKGDTSTDKIVSDVPGWVSPVKPSSAPTLKLSGLWAAFEKARVGKIARGTMPGYRRKFSSLTTFLKDKMADDVTADDIYAWAAFRQTKEGGGVRPDIVEKNDVSAISAVFKWAMKKVAGNLVTHNPASDIDLDAKAPPKGREKKFTGAEVQRILIATLRPESNPRYDFPERLRARRWVPWICAYTGARVTEITQLRREDVFLDGNVWMLRITPDAGTVKDAEMRLVPVHSHLVEQGFIKVVEAVPSGPLFYDPARRKKDSEAFITIAALQSQKLGEWIKAKGQLAKSGASPNHSWRHTWKSIAAGAGIDQVFRDAITGHAGRGVASDYEHVSEWLAEHMSKFPRYKLDGEGLVLSVEPSGP
jgi:integrase